MNKAELIEAVAKESGLSKADAKRALEAFVSTTTNALKAGDKVALVGFGSFSTSNDLNEKEETHKQEQKLRLLPRRW